MTYFIDKPVLCTLIAGAFVWLMTSLGSASVFFIKSFSAGAHSAILGVTGGIMVAASFWSLLSPSVDASLASGIAPWIALSAGLVSGALFLAFADAASEKIGEASRLPGQNSSRAGLLMLSLTVHNIPEGLAVGVAFGLLGKGGDPSAFAGAAAIAFGIGIQNFPEGAAVSLPMYKSGSTRFKSFLLGALSGAVEPAAALVGVTCAGVSAAVLPFFLSFAAGAMLYVAVGEMIPQADRLKRSASLWGFMAGFLVMTVLDVML